MQAQCFLVPGSAMLSRGSRELIGASSGYRCTSTRALVELAGLNQVRRLESWVHKVPLLIPTPRNGRVAFAFFSHQTSAGLFLVMRHGIFKCLTTSLIEHMLRGQLFAIGSSDTEYFASHPAQFTVFNWTRHWSLPSGSLIRTDICPRNLPKAGVYCRGMPNIFQSSAKIIAIEDCGNGRSSTEYVYFYIVPCTVTPVLSTAEA